MADVRRPAVAGTFYPSFGPALRAAINGYLDASLAATAVPKAIIAPHAGYVYSGPVAGAVYAALIPARSTVRRVVIIGPAHRVHVTGLAVSRASAFRTPLGDVPVDLTSVDLVRALPGVIVSENAHAAEHCIEVQLPFLQVVLSDFAIVPILAGTVDDQSAAKVLQSLWGGGDTLIVVSTDLSHYLTYQQAVDVDGATASAICDLNGAAIADSDACGAVAVRALLLVAKRLGLSVSEVRVCNSGDTAGPKDRVVGYAAFTVR